MPILRIATVFLKKWCGWRDSNSHAVKHRYLKPACLPFHHIRIMVSVAGFEPTTSCTQNKRTTRLCYTEILVGVPGIEPGMRFRDGVTVHCLTLRRDAQYKCGRFATLVLPRTSTASKPLVKESLAVRVGFEPTVDFHPRWFSRPEP